MSSPHSTFRSLLFRKLLPNKFVVIAPALFVLDFYVTRYTADWQRRIIRIDFDSQLLITGD